MFIDDLSLKSSVFCNVQDKGIITFPLDSLCQLRFYWLLKFFPKKWTVYYCLIECCSYIVLEGNRKLVWGKKKDKSEKNMKI